MKIGKKFIENITPLNRNFLQKRLDISSLFFYNKNREKLIENITPLYGIYALGEYGESRGIRKWKVGGAGGRKPKPQWG